MLKRIRPYLSVGLLVVVLVIAAIYLSHHVYLLTDLSHTPLLIGISLILLYVLLLIVLTFKFSITLKICSLRLPNQENIKLNANTLLINFFIPGQGGPIYNGVYLKSRHKLKVKHFISSMLIYYIIYALLSVGCLLVSSRPWWQTILAVLTLGLVSLWLSRRYMKKSHINKQSLNLHVASLSWLTLATVLQIVVQTIIYAIELRSVNKTISLSQIITYTGAANLAMFVALTPGAIGIRESFLLFTEKLNHISSNNILVASLLDRSVYLVFLGIIGLITLIFQLYKRISTKSTNPVIKAAAK